MMRWALQANRWDLPLRVSAGLYGGRRAWVGDNSSGVFESQQRMNTVDRLARWSAYFGGLLLLGVALMVVTSVAGRGLVGLGLGPVPGDFELVEMGTAGAIFFCLPWCSLRNGHATVDLLHARLPPWAQRGANLASDVLMLLAWCLLTWQLWAGLQEKREYQETTFVLQWPLWWAYGACLAGAVVGCLCHAGRALVRLGWVLAPTAWNETQPVAKPLID